jgi:hypothetical protein
MTSELAAMRLAASETNEQVRRLSEGMLALRNQDSSALVVPGLVEQVTTSLYDNMRRDVQRVSEEMKNILSRQVALCNEEMYDKMWTQMKPVLDMLDGIQYHDTVGLSHQG